jgi:hypothetical protein
MCVVMRYLFPFCFLLSRSSAVRRSSVLRGAVQEACQGDAHELRAVGCPCPLLGFSVGIQAEDPFLVRVQSRTTGYLFLLSHSLLSWNFFFFALRAATCQYQPGAVCEVQGAERLLGIHEESGTASILLLLASTLATLLLSSGPV